MSSILIPAISWHHLWSMNTHKISRKYQIHCYSQSWILLWYDDRSIKTVQERRHIIGRVTITLFNFVAFHQWNILCSSSFHDSMMKIELVKRQRARGKGKAANENFRDSFSLSPVIPLEMKHCTASSKTLAREKANKRMRKKSPLAMIKMILGWQEIFCFDTDQ